MSLLTLWGFVACSRVNVTLTFILQQLCNQRYVSKYQVVKQQIESSHINYLSCLEIVKVQ
jgi:hypothetical protein